MRNVCHLKVKLLFALFGFIGTFQLLVLYSVKDNGLSYGLYSDNENNPQHKRFGMSELILVLWLFLLSLNYLQSEGNVAEVLKSWEMFLSLKIDKVFVPSLPCLSSCKVGNAHNVDTEFRVTSYDMLNFKWLENMLDLNRPFRCVTWN